MRSEQSGTGWLHTATTQQTLAFVWPSQHQGRTEKHKDTRVMKGWIDRYLMFCTESNVEGLYQGKTKCVGNASQILIQCLIHVTLMIKEVWGKIKLKELGRQKLCRQPCQQVQHAKLYFSIYYRLRKREPLIALGYLQRGLQFMRPWYPILEVMKRESELHWSR